MLLQYAFHHCPPREASFIIKSRELQRRRIKHCVAEVVQQDTCNKVQHEVLESVQEDTCSKGMVLSLLQMPEELLYDPQVLELREEIKGLQADFIDTHKALDAAQEQVK
jgi:hypothetical protein